MYARGMSHREIQGHLREIYGIEVSPDFISSVTDAVMEEVREWQNRPLDPVYAIVFFDVLFVKMREEGLVKNRAVYEALAIKPDGEKVVLGLWIEQAEGAKFWLKIMNELKSRGVEDILIAVVDGLKGFPETINAVFARTIVQTWIVHMIRNSLASVSWKDRKAMIPSLRSVYGAPSEAEALARLDDLEAPWGARYPPSGPMWRRHWTEIAPMFAFPPAIRKMIYTTNAVEALNRSCARSSRPAAPFRARRQR